MHVSYQRREIRERGRERERAGKREVREREGQERGIMLSLSESVSTTTGFYGDCSRGSFSRRDSCLLYYEWLDNRLETPFHIIDSNFETASVKVKSHFLKVLKS